MRRSPVEVAARMTVWILTILPALTVGHCGSVRCDGPGGSPLREPLFKKARLVADDFQEIPALPVVLSRPEWSALPVEQARVVMDDTFDLMVANGNLSQELREQIKTLSPQERDSFLKELVRPEESTDFLSEMMIQLADAVRHFPVLLREHLGCKDDCPLLFRSGVLTGEIDEVLKAIPPTVQSRHLGALSARVKESFNTLVGRKNALLSDVQLLIDSKSKE